MIIIRLEDILMKKLLFPAIFAALIFFGCQNREMKESKAAVPTIKKAVAVLQPINGSDVHGIVYFNDKGGTIEVVADVNGLAPGEHGFHIHT